MSLCGAGHEDKSLTWRAPPPPPPGVAARAHQRRRRRRERRPTVDNKHSQVRPADSQRSPLEIADGVFTFCEFAARRAHTHSRNCTQHSRTTGLASCVGGGDDAGRTSVQMIDAICSQWAAALRSFACDCLRVCTIGSAAAHSALRARVAPAALPVACARRLILAMIYDLRARSLRSTAAAAAATQRSFVGRRNPSSGGRCFGGVAAARSPGRDLWAVAQNAARKPADSCHCPFVRPFVRLSPRARALSPQVTSQRRR